MSLRINKFNRLVKLSKHSKLKESPVAMWPTGGSSSCEYCL